MVSAKTGVGVKDLMKDLDHKIGSRGDVWILGRRTRQVEPYPTPLVAIARCSRS